MYFHTCNVAAMSGVVPETAGDDLLTKVCVCVSMCILSMWMCACVFSCVQLPQLCLLQPHPALLAPALLAPALLQHLHYWRCTVGTCVVGTSTVAAPALLQQTLLQQTPLALPLLLPWQHVL